MNIDTKVETYTDGTKSYYKGNKRHREDGPAIECSNGDKFWYINGKQHREDGPAVEYANGRKYYYLNDVMMSQEEHFCQVASLVKETRDPDIQDLTIRDIERLVGAKKKSLNKIAKLLGYEIKLVKVKK